MSTAAAQNQKFNINRWHLLVRSWSVGWKNLKLLILTGVDTCSPTLNAHGQCDQMAWLFFNISWFTTGKSCPKHNNFAKVGSKFCQKLNKPSTIWQIDKILPKWRNFVKSGYTAHGPLGIVKAYEGSYLPNVHIVFRELFYILLTFHKHNILGTTILSLALALASH